MLDRSRFRCALATPCRRCDRAGSHAERTLAAMAHRGRCIVAEPSLIGRAPGKGRLTPAGVGRGQGLLAQLRVYFFLAGAFWLLRNEMPVRIAFCWTAAAVRPRAFAACAAVPLAASFFRVLSSLALQEAPSLEGRFAIIISKC